MYTKEMILKAAEIGEVLMVDAKHIVSLLDEAKYIIQGKTVYCSCNYESAIVTDDKVICLGCKKEVNIDKV